MSFMNELAKAADEMIERKAEARLDIVADDICRDYCKYMEKFGATPELTEQCRKCPLRNL